MHTMLTTLAVGEMDFLSIRAEYTTVQVAEAL